MRHRIITFLSFLLLVFLDQLTKFWAVQYVKPVGTIPLLKDIFSFTYVENKGAAFGILQNRKLFFLISTLLVIAFLGYTLWKMPKEKHYLPLLADCILLVSGAAGNLIDRIFHTYVIDFLSFDAIHFPVFNVADCYVTIGAVIFFFLLMFYYKEEEEFQFLRP